MHFVFVNVEAVEGIRIKIHVEEPVEVAAWKKWRMLLIEYLRNKRYHDNRKATAAQSVVGPTNEAT